MITLINIMQLHNSCTFTLEGLHGQHVQNGNCPEPTRQLGFVDTVNMYKFMWCFHKATPVLYLPCKHTKHYPEPVKVLASILSKLLTQLLQFLISIQLTEKQSRDPYRIQLH